MESYGSSAFSLLRSHQTFPEQLPPCTPVPRGCSSFSTALPTLVVVCLFGCNHPNGLDWHFPVTKNVAYFFHVLVDRLYIFFGEIPVQNCHSFFNWVVILLLDRRVLYVFWM